MKKRLTAGILALALWLTLIPLSLQKAEATQSCSAQFRSGYSLTGNGADDLVAVAAAQVGMRTEDFGYTEDWCADFIADCATLAGLSKLIPANGAVSAMRSAVIAAGSQYWEYTAADTINNIKKGDIIVLETNRHIAIVEYVDSQGIHCLDGNWGSATPMVTRVLRSFDNNSNTDWHQYITMVLRPAYAAKHTVSFQTNYSGGEAIAAQTVSDGGCLGSLPKPIREGYAFLGWFSDPEDGEAFTVNTPVYNDLTLYAHWGFLEAGNSCGDSVSWSLSDGVLTIWGNGAIKD
ncbi:MAG: InlB B-repeat-containing protein [Oscillospiraceae bacterium]|nr:InlB B-repeat-containing protein [Oscillospiraceae bacterium]